jgi:integrase
VYGQPWQCPFVLQARITFRFPKLSQQATGPLFDSPAAGRRLARITNPGALATHLIARNVNLAVVKKALGHKSINSTMIYVTVSDRQAGDASRAALMSLY